MQEDRDRLKLGVRRLPELRLPSAPAGTPTPLRPSGRVSPVLLLAHGPDCDGCRAYLRALAASADEIAEWDGRLIAVVPAPPDSAAAFPSDDANRITVLADPDGALAARLSLSGAALLIADQYGEIHHAVDANPGHDLPSAKEVVDWLRYLAIQCPECQGEAL